jgi:hypothetical protein
MNAVTAPLKAGQRGALVVDLQTALQWLLEKFRGFPLEDAQRKEAAALLGRELTAQTYGPTTGKLVALFQRAANLPTTGVVDAATAEAINQRVEESRGDVGVPGTGPGSGRGDVAVLTGTALLQRRQPAAGVGFQLVQLTLDGGEKPLGEKALSNAAGGFSIPFTAPMGPMQWQLRLADGTPLIGVKVGRPESEPLTVIVPDSAVAADDEWTRLLRDASAMGVGLDRLAALKELDTRKDLSALAAATGWDVRVLALAATAASIAQAAKMPSAAVYAVLRTGTALDVSGLVALAPDALVGCLTRANKAHLVSLTDAEIQAAVTAITRYAVTTRLQTVPKGLVSSPATLLAGSGLSDADKAAFGKTLQAIAGSTSDLWQTATQQGVSPAGIKTLQRQGKLAVLTAHSAPLSAGLAAQLKESPEVGDLAFQGYYTADAWSALIDKVAAAHGVTVASLIPSGIQGDTDAARKVAYASSMAQLFRVSYPTRSIAAQVLSGNVVAGQNADEQKALADTLKAADDVGFVIGRTPVGPFLKSKGDGLFAGVAADVRRQQEVGLRCMHRLYQLSPDDSSMAVLSTLGLDDARKISAFSEREFLEYAGDKFDAADADRSAFVARRVHAKAKHVDSTARALVTITQQAVQNAPLIPMGGGRGVPPPAQKAIVQAFPSMESLFGNQDYCECESCRSVLSPAAYFVDLLHYIDPDAPKWQAFLDRWKVQHGGASYPHVDGTTGKPLSPYDVLMSRRPDLATLELTCDNTNAVLPYVDLVNEILEGYIDGGLTPSPTSYDSAGLASADLVSEPQNVNKAVYDKLRAEPFPVSLPFDLWTSAARAYAGQADTPYWKLLDAFRTDDRMFVEPAGSVPYAGEQVLTERLGITRAAADLLIAAGNTLTWRALYGLDGAGDTDATARAALANAKSLALRLSVSQKELVALFQTRFVNPTLASLAALNKLGISVELVCRWKGAPGYPALSTAEQAGLQQRLDALKAESGEDVQQWIDAGWAAGDFDRAVLLKAPASGCDPSQIQISLARANPGAPADALDLTFVRLNVMVRLWRRLEWALSELDDALCLLLPPDSVDSAAKVGPAMRVAFVGLAHQLILGERLKVGKKARQKVGVFWGDIPSFGSTSLYRDLFLGNRAAVDAKVFDRVTSQLLPGTVLLGSQREAVQAALGLSADDMAAIFAAARIDNTPGVAMTLDNAPLSLAVVSLLYRHALLAQGLKAPLGDVIDLMALTGINPFTPRPAAGTTLAQLNVPDAAPGAAAVHFVRLFDGLKAAGISVADLRYWLRHERGAKDVGPRTEAQVVQALHALAAARDQVRSNYQIPADAGLVTSDVLTQRLAVCYPADVVATWVGMLDGSTRFTARVAAAAPLIGTADLAGEPALTAPLQMQAAYDGIRSVQQLTCTGVLTQTLHDALAAKFPAVQGLLDDLRAQAVAIFDTWFKADLPGLAFDTLFDPARSREARYADVLPRLFPKCLDAAEPAALLAGLATLTGAEAGRIAALGSDATLLRDPASPAPPGNAVAISDALRQAVEPGVSASYFAAANGTGAPTLSARVAAPEARAYLAVTTLSAADQATADAAKSIQFDGVIVVPAGGAYRFGAIAGGANERFLFTLTEAAGANFDVTATKAGEEVKGAAMDLEAGVPYHYRAVLQSRVAGSAATFSVRGEPLPALQDFRGVDRWSLDSVATTGRCLSLLDKVLLLVRRVPMEDRELYYLLSHGGALADTGFSDLPTELVVVDGAHPPLAATAAMSRLFAGWAAYATLRKSVELSPGAWADVLAATTQSTPGAANDAAAREAACQQFATSVGALLEASPGLVRAGLKSLGADQAAVLPVALVAGARTVTMTSLTTVSGLARLMDVLRVAARFGVQADKLQAWVTPAPSSDAAAGLRQILKSRYAEADWQQAVKPIADTLRRQRRDALVAYLLNRLGLEVQEQLYERFLVDPGMEPVVTTSRIRLAISSVQRFVDRVLQNYEPNVHPSTLTAEWWPRLQHYPVWAAARQFVLFPNWLEPEFRDDQSYLFKALMARLLQGNVDRDTVEDAFFEYLQGLDQIARLQFVNAYQEDVGDGVIHVIGRTFASPHKYYYRRNEHTVWTPWETVGVDIEGDHVTAIVWRGRLCLFWLTVIDKSQPNSGAQGTSFKALGDGTIGAPAAQPTHTWDVRLNWSELINGDWVPRSAANDQHTIRFGPLSSEYRPEALFTFVKKRYENGEESGVEIHVVQSTGENSSNGTAFLVRSRHAPPELLFAKYDSQVQFRYWSESVGQGGELATQYVNEDTRLTAHFHQTVGDDSLATDAPIFQHADLKTFWLLPVAYAEPPYHNEIADLSVPFFYTDHDNSFFVEPVADEHSVRGWRGWTLGDSYWKGLAAATNPKVAGPRFPEVVDPALVRTADPAALYAVTPGQDWATAPGTVIRYGSASLGARVGGPEL